MRLQQRDQLPVLLELRGQKCRGSWQVGGQVAGSGDGEAVACELHARHLLLERSKEGDCEIEQLAALMEQQLEVAPRLSERRRHRLVHVRRLARQVFAGRLALTRAHL